MADVLNTRLRDTLREELGGTYSVSASASYVRDPRSQYTVSINFGCSPDRTEELVERVFDEIASLQTDGPTEQQVSDVRETFLRDFEVNMEQNRFVAAQLSYKYQYGEDPAEILDIPAHYRKLTVTAIRDAARQYLNLESYVKVTLFPEKLLDQSDLKGVSCASTLRSLRRVQPRRVLAGSRRAARRAGT